MNHELTQQRLKLVVHYDPETGDFSRLITTSNRVKTGDEAGTITHGYCLIWIDGRRYRAHKLAWLYMTGSWPARNLDHINGNKADNRWENLREATPSQNGFNARRHHDNQSGHKGVSWDAAAGKWRAQICVNYKQTNLGRHDTFAEACMARDSAASQLHGTYARID